MQIEGALSIRALHMECSMSRGMRYDGRIMQIVELYLQGVKGFPSQARIELAPGLTVLRADPDAAIRPAIEALLFPDGRSASELQLEADGAPACRAAVTFRSADGTIWRVVRDLRGASSLQRWDADAGKFVSLTSNPSEIGPYLRTQAKIPNHDSYAELFTISGADFPSTRPVPDGGFALAAAPSPHATGGLPGALPGGLQGGLQSGKPSGLHGGLQRGSRVGAPGGLQAPQGGFPGFQGSASFGALSAMAVEAPAAAPVPTRELVEALERELVEATELEALQQSFDGVHARLHELEERIKAVARLEADEADARAALEAFASDAALGDGLGEKLEAYRRAEARREAALARIAADREALEEVRSAPPRIPLKADRRLWASCAAGLIFWVVALLSPWKPVALLSIPSFGVGAALALLYTSELQRRERHGRRFALFGEREAKVEGEWESETREVREAARRAGLERVDDLGKWLQARREARQRLADASRRLEEARADPALAAAEEERARVAAQAEHLEKEMGARAASAYRSAGEIRGELERLRNPAPETHLGLPFAEPGLGLEPPMVSEAPPPRWEVAAEAPDASARLLEKVEGLFHVSREELLSAMGARASKYLEALTGRRYTSLSWFGGGGVICSGPDGQLRFTQLEPRHQDLVWLSLRLTVIERWVGRYPIPIILDEPFEALSPQRQALVARMLEGISAKTQIVHRTRLQAMFEGKTVVELG